MKNMTVLLWLLATSLFAQTLNNTSGIGPFQPGAAYSYPQFLGPFFTQPWFVSAPTSLVISTQGGLIYVGNGAVTVAPVSLTMSANQTSCTRPAMTTCNFVYSNSTGTLATSTSFTTATANGNTLLALVTTTATGVTNVEGAYQDVALGVPNVQLGDAFFDVPPGSCALNLSGGTLTGTNGLQVVGASFTPVVLLATTTATETTTIVCHIIFNSRTTAGKGLQLNDVVLWYGNSVGITATCNAPTLGTITAPTPGAGETASPVAPVSLGAVTVTPIVGSCNTAVVTAGQFYSEKVVLTTPYAISTDLTDIVFSQSFVGPTTAAYTLYTKGLTVHVSNTPF